MNILISSNIDETQKIVKNIYVNAGNIVLTLTAIQARRVIHMQLRIILKRTTLATKSIDKEVTTQLSNKL